VGDTVIQVLLVMFAIGWGLGAIAGGIISAIQGLGSTLSRF
jgi:hypothetical protein